MFEECRHIIDGHMALRGQGRNDSLLIGLFLARNGNRRNLNLTWRCVTVARKAPASLCASALSGRSAAIDPRTAGDDVGSYEGTGYRITEWRAADPVEAGAASSTELVD